jgi:hypothetical protein
MKHVGPVTVLEMMNATTVIKDFTIWDQRLVLKPALMGLYRIVLILTVFLARRIAKLAYRRILRCA